MDFKVREKNSGGAFAQCAHVVRIFVKTPTIRRHESNGSVNRFQVRIGSFTDFFPRPGIDRIERDYLNPEVVSMRAKRTDQAAVRSGFLRIRYSRRCSIVGAAYVSNAKAPAVLAAFNNNGTATT